MGGLSSNAHTVAPHPESRRQAARPRVAWSSPPRAHPRAHGAAGQVGAGWALLSPVGGQAEAKISR